MSKVVSLRLKDDQVARLERAARGIGRTPSETAALLLEEGLRGRDFAFIEFRDSPVGRQAYLKGRRLTVWQVVWLVRDFDGDVEQTAVHLEIPSLWVEAACKYAAAYPKEIEDAIADNEAAAETLPRLLPNLQVFEFKDAGAAAPR